MSETFARSAERLTIAAVESLRTAMSEEVRREVERLVADLSDAAARDMDNAVAQVQRDAEFGLRQQQMHAEAAAQAKLQQARAESEALRHSIEGLEAEIQRLASADAEVQKVRAESTSARAVASAEIERLSAALREAQGIAAAARRDLFDRTTQIADLERHLDGLEQSHRQMQAALATNQARVAIDAHERTALENALDAAQQAAIAARAQAEVSDAEARDASAQLAVLRHLPSRQSTVEKPLARLRTALCAFTGLTDARDLLETFVQQLGREFDRVALFAVRENWLEGQRSVGFDPPVDVRNVVVPLTMDSPLTRAVSETSSVIVGSGAEGPIAGPLGHDTDGAIAIPLMLKGHVAGVAYAESARNDAEEDRQSRFQMAEILADQLMQSLSRLVATPANVIRRNIDGDDAASPPVPLPAASTYDGPPRAVERLRVPADTEVLLDGESVQLVDIATRGAQVVSTKTVRPNQPVRMVVPGLAGAILCQGRIAWSRLEMTPRGMCYRAGVTFTTVDSDALEALLNHQFATHYRTSA